MILDEPYINRLEGGEEEGEEEEEGEGRRREGEREEKRGLVKLAKHTYSQYC